MKLLGIDYGEKRIGVATSAMGMSTPLCTLVNNTSLINEFKKIITEQRTQKIVIGLPLYKDGTESPNCPIIREFGAKLEAEFNIPVVFHNELLTSWEAEEYIKQTKHIKDPKKIKDMIDKVAASMLLQSYGNEKNN